MPCRVPARAPHPDRPAPLCHVRYTSIPSAYQTHAPLITTTTTDITATIRGDVQTLRTSIHIIILLARLLSATESDPTVFGKPSSARCLQPCHFPPRPSNPSLFSRRIQYVSFTLLPIALSFSSVAPPSSFSSSAFPHSLTYHKVHLHNTSLVLFPH